MNYPEHEKLRKVAPLSQAQGDFIEWLNNEKGIVLASHEGGERLWPVHASTQALLAEYHNIDQRKLELEKRAMIRELRRSSMKRRAKS